MKQRIYKTPKKKENKKESTICEYCLVSTKDKKEYYWVDMGDHYILVCIDCIEEHDLVIGKPYFESKKKQKE